jgi:ComF family protein
MRPPASIFARLSEQARQLSDAALDLLFPPRCVVCRRPGELLCRRCAQAFPALEEPLCAICSVPVRGGDLCPKCRRSRPVYGRVISAFDYRDGVRKAIHALKYDKKPDLAGLLVAELCQVVGPPGEKVDALCGVPMTEERRLERGYNHADLLAQALARQWNLPLLPGGALSRIGGSARQVELDAGARRENVRGAFLADAGVVAGLTVMIVDDVCTTGATLEACAGALLAAGADRPLGVTLARTLPREPDPVAV